jgi:hypothetical protein
MKKSIIETSIKQIADLKADVLTSRHERVIDQIVNFYKKNNTEQRICRPYYGGGDFFMTTKKNKNKNAKLGTIFENLASAHRKTWAEIQLILEPLSEKLNLKKQGHNYLANLLTPSDKDFLAALGENNSLPCAGELGHIIVQRLKCIAANHKSPPSSKGTANILLTTHLSGVYSTLLHYDEETLESALSDLISHAIHNPENKVIWLGSARTVNGMKKSSDLCTLGNNPIATFLNCPDDKWTWELNRAWLMAAVELDYEFRLVEQHYPNVESAILSGSPVSVLIEMANEIRSEKNPSQYNGTDEPTATTQEILVLLDLGCVPKKNNDNSLSLLSPTHRIYSEDDIHFSFKHLSQLKTNQATSSSSSSSSIQAGLGLQRRHSCPNFFKAGPLPPIGSFSEHFKEPEKSPLIRSKLSKE